MGISRTDPRGRISAAAAGCLLATACAASTRQFPLRAPVWIDDDQLPVVRAPARYTSPLLWDAADQSAFGPLTRVLAATPTREAINVNALDEVPDSSWFANRLSLHTLTPEQMAAGPCANVAPPPQGSWEIISGKPDGFASGFFARGPDGRRYLLKADGVAQSQQPTGADVIGSRLYWAAGYHTPCNRVISVRREDLRLAPGARAEDSLGRPRPMTAAQIDAVTAQATREPDGALRLSASLALEGRPLGPFRYEGLREDDPNDVVPHQHRRDLRGARVLAAWLGHFDARAQNTLDTLITGPRGAFVRHHMLDFTDCLGAIWPSDAMSRHTGHSYYFDFRQIGEDWLSLGFVDRPWDHSVVDADGWIFGYFDARSFDPARWRPGYPNPAFEEMTELDAAWMARILARVGPAHLRAVIAEARFRSERWNTYLANTLLARRNKILARYLLRRSPLAEVSVLGGRLCAGDRAREAGLYRRANYIASVRGGARDSRRDPLVVDAAETGPVCVELPAPAPRNARTRPDDPARYHVIEISTEPDGLPAVRLPLRAHLYDLGPTQGWVLAGLER